MKILLLEDDDLLAESLQEYLEMEGFVVDTARRGEEVFDKTFEERYDLYILDINVPDLNGFDVLKALKEADDSTPAIYISALSDIASITQGFDLGALDYLKKPFDPEELVIRIKRFFAERREGKISHGRFVFDPRTGEVQMESGERLVLGEIQRKILYRLLQSPGTVVTTGELMELLENPSANALRVTLAKLKKKLPLEIVNIRGQGYRLEKV